MAVVESKSRPEPADYALTAYWRGKEVGRYPLRIPDSPPYSTKVSLDGNVLIDQLVLTAVQSKGITDVTKPVELVRQTIQLPEVEADTIARPDTVINPVDLGTILVPSGWLLLGPKQSATLDFAAINRGADLPKAHLSTSFDSSSGHRGINDR